MLFNFRFALFLLELFLCLGVFVERIQKYLIGLASTLSLASCEGNFDLWDRGYGLIFNKEEHYRLAEETGSEDIYEDYVGAYETEESETVYTYDNECIHCHHHRESEATVHHSRRIY